MKNNTANERNTISGCILAGGAGKRVGGRDKGLINLAGKPVVSHVMNRISAQVEKVYVSANRNLNEYKRVVGNVVTDDTQDFLGPLAGILAALKFIKSDNVAFVPCDCPFFPRNLVEKLFTDYPSSAETIRVASVNERVQPVFAIIPTSLSASLSDYLSSGERKIMNWYENHKVEKISFGNLAEFDNLNNHEDFLKAEKRINQSEERKK